MPAYKPVSVKPGIPSIWHAASKKLTAITVLVLCLPSLAGFQRCTSFGREKGACDLAPEASADRSIFLWITRVSALFAERNLHLVISSVLRFSRYLSVNMIFHAMIPVA
jgi:hypothetical protein